MNAILAGIGKSLSIWPDTDYRKLLPKNNSTERAWAKVGSNLRNSIAHYDASFDANLEALTKLQLEKLEMVREQLTLELIASYEQGYDEHLERIVQRNKEAHKLMLEKEAEALRAQLSRLEQVIDEIKTEE